MPGYIRRLITEGAEEGKRSEAIWSVLHYLVARGMTDSQVLWLFNEHLIGNKAKEKPSPYFMVAQSDQ